MKSIFSKNKAWVRANGDGIGTRSHKLLAMMFALVVCPAITGELWAQRGRGGPPPVPAVVTAKVQEISRVPQQSFVGTVTPIRLTTVGSAIDGRVSEVLVEEGDRVVVDREAEDAALTGFPLVQLRTDSIQIEIDAANVELQIREQALAELEVSLPNEIEQSKAFVAELEARTTLAEADFVRISGLYESSGGVSRQDYDAAFSAQSTAQSALTAARAQQRKLETTHQAKLSQEQARVQAQREEIRRLEDMKSKYTIRAPFSGYVISKMTEAGQWVSRGTDVIKIVQMDPIEVTVNVPQSVLLKIQRSLDSGSESTSSSSQVAKQVTSVRLPATIELDNSAETFEGHVSRIIPQADLRSRTFPVKIEISNPRTRAGHLLQPGMLAEVTIAAGTPTPGLFVMKDALVLGGQNPVIFVVKPAANGKTEAHPVTVITGNAWNDLIQVTGEVAAGDRVVVEGNERLNPPRPGPGGKLVYQEVRVVRELESGSDPDTGESSLSH